MKTTKTKVKIEVFVPLGSCVCTFALFMEKVGRVTSRFKGVTEVQMKSNNHQKLLSTEFKIWESSSTGRSSFQQVLKRKNFKMQYLKKSGVSNVSDAGESEKVFVNE